jgi:UDP-N-acetylglucosamine diphosphorylase / glucose-1-phosphate thymidylyltransferase / UDP-N-acetylgalactosamine diphosphorylase / glucosamine-1-phosphate N-acetyltransferase / galactosamine-1-phosphate N-acetyltransferase
LGTGPRLVLFDDRRARTWAPFSLTRPVGELRFGAHLLRERSERALRLPCAGHLGSPHLEGWREHGSAPVLSPADLTADRPTVFLCARAVLERGPEGDWGSDAAVIVVGDRSAGCYVPAGGELPTGDALLEARFAATRAIELPGVQLEEVWDLVAQSPDRTARDVLAAGAAGALPRGVAQVGDAPLRIGRNVHIEPHVLLDLRGGPIWLDDDVTVRAFTRVEGPAYIGRSTTLLGGPFTAVSIGPHCKVHGEVEETVFLGYSNKAHDGFLGHAYAGRWVNLGALSTNSDLKNNYGSIRLWTPEGERDTGLLKLGCLLGDHVKTGIGMLLNTGTVVGAGSNLYGAGMPPKYVPPFSWGSSSELVGFELEKFLSVARTVMERRGVELGEAERACLERAWQIGRADAESSG